MLYSKLLHVGEWKPPLLYYVVSFEKVLYILPTIKKQFYV